MPPNRGLARGTADRDDGDGEDSVRSRRSRVETETRKISGNIYRFTDGLYTKGTQAHIHRKLI